MPHRPRPPRASVALAALSFVVVVAAAMGPAAADTRAAGPLTGVVVAIDPGHNGGNATHARQTARRIWIGNAWKRCNSVGTATRSGFTEHRFNFLVARAVQTRLQALGATVYLTRTTDRGVGPCIDVRGRFGAQKGADLMVSIHADGARSSYRGFFVMRPGLVKGYTDDIVTGSARLATAMRRGLLAARLPIANYYARSGIKTRTDLGTLNFSDVPTVMVELGNMKNSGDAARMKSTSGRAQYANGIVAGIRRYLGK
jgi:N-acetylmuramoyl-L-alanine amidase